MKTWQTLLIQAFRQTPIKSSRKSHCGFFSINGFIYQSLSKAGIENRNPFSFWQLIVIRFQSKGDPDSIRELCIEHISMMRKPVRGFYASAFIVGFITLVISCVLLVIPKTATTFRTPSNGTSILKLVPPPIPDIDSAQLELPVASDYLMSVESIQYLKSLNLIDNTSLGGKKWIYQQPDSSYSLQLVSASTANQLQAFCKKYKICGSSAIYQTEVKGKNIVRLLYGVFPSFASAKQAKSELPIGLQKTNPWARQFKRIKQEL